ncbi:hypothetical protein OG455_20485 [Kitasatospora sp. NBC_01287]|uniref:hypothetical protein n=1 Tax=Kitasatospora sp. NBC_01287 TaxID=2903573 RepID=UPI00225C315E|nr:hypothetical protein [Kitasatospora sp. NBC_01287]MCX4747865.1 hypothetical protein [Kitasatospora sp. NBC_01287]
MSAPDPVTDVRSDVRPVEASVTATEPPGARSGRLPRAVTITLATVGLLAITAASATVTVAVGRPGHHRSAAASAAGPLAAAPSPGALPSASPTPVPLPSITLAPAPASTLHGTVSGDSHSGDLRYFLLPVPGGAQPYGDPDGTALTVADIAKDYDKPGDTQGILDSYGYQEAVSRRYRSADGQTEVSTRLMRFSSADNARAFAQSTGFDSGTSIPVTGDSSAKGFLFKPDQQAFTGEMAGVSSVGDVEYEVHVYVKGDPDTSLLSTAMQGQHDRLGSGG